MPVATSSSAAAETLSASQNATATLPRGLPRACCSCLQFLSLLFSPGSQPFTASIDETAAMMARAAARINIPALTSAAGCAEQSALMPDRLRAWWGSVQL